MTDTGGTVDTRKLPWRVGRKVGRTIYATADGDDDGFLIGMMDSPDLATAACDAHNNELEAEQTGSFG